MAGIYNDDESTDEEFGVNLHLVERLRINRGESSNFFEDRNFESPKDLKQYCNMRRKKFAQGGQSSSSSSLEMHNDSSTSGLVSSDIYPNKKRQNVDKNTEQLGNPKRTCLSDRLRRTPDWRELRRKNTLEIQSQPPLLPDSYYLKPGTSSNLLSDKKKEENIAKLADESDSDFEIPFKKINRSSKIENGQCSKSTKCQSTAPNKKNQAINHENIASTSYLNKFFDSSDDESKSILQNGALKGGRQESSNDHNLFTKRLVNRKINKKLLESDDSEDDNSVSAYRSRPLVFSSSDSDDSRQNALKSKHTDSVFNSSHSWSDSFDKNAGHRSRQHKSFRSNPKYSKKAYNSVPSNKTENTEGCDRQFLSSDYQRKNGTHRSCRTRRSPRINITANLTSNGFSNGNNISGPVRGRRANGSDRGGRRSGSPHPRMARSQPKNDDSKCGRGRSVSASRTQKDKSNYSARYPDLLFDAEESDNEFFTANSYSDTETSTESLGGLTINTTFPNHNGSISCTINCEDRLFEDVSSDDEISVVFSTSPFGRNDSRRGASRTLGRRHSRGTPHRQIPSVREIVSLSPDPVEQVRQMEEDERMARMLQAQYDAEVDPDYSPVNNHLMEPEETDDEILDPLGDSDSDDPNNTLSFSPFLPIRRGFAVNRFSNRTSSPAAIFLAQYDAEVEPDYSPVSNYLMEPEDSADVILDPFGYSDSDDLNNTLSFPPFYLIRRGFGVNQVSNRTSSPAAVFLGRRMDSRNRRRHQTSREPAENHLNRLLHLGMHDMSQFFGGDYYEALLSLDLDGEVVPRGLPRSDINRLPTRKYIHPNSIASSSSSSSEVTHKRTDLNKECQVCLSDYANGDILRILPCFHEFHTPCIDPWLTINQTCPVCRVSVDLDA